MKRLSCCVDCVDCEVTLLCEEVRQFLGLEGPAEMVEIGSWHAQDPKFKSLRVSFSVESVDGLSEIKIQNAYTVPILNLSKRPISHEKIVRKWPHLAEVPFSSVGTAEVKLLIGMDHTDPNDVFQYREDPLLQNAPKAILTASLVRPSKEISVRP